MFLLLRKKWKWVFAILLLLSLELLAIFTLTNGRSLRVVLIDHNPWTSAIEDHLSTFQQDTGISLPVEIEKYPALQLREKVVLAFAAGNSIDVFMHLTGDTIYSHNGWVAPSRAGSPATLCGFSISAYKGSAHLEDTRRFITWASSAHIAGSLKCQPPGPGQAGEVDQ